MPTDAAPPTPPSRRTSTRPRDARLESYKAFLRIPSISALPEHADDCRRAAEWLADGADRGRRSSTPRSSRPAATRSSTPTGSTPPDAPTVLVYGHYDVQPVDPLDLWTSPPFEPVVVGDRILARGAADDKGQIHAHVMAAEALLATRGALPGQPQVRVRGRGGVELGQPRRAGSRPTASGSRPTSRSSATPGFFEGNLPAITRRPARPDVRPDRRRRDRRSTCIRAATAAPSRTRPTRWPRSSPRSRAPTAGSGSRASTTTSSPLTDADRAAHRRAAVRRGGLPRSDSALPALVGEAGFTTLERTGARPTLDVNGIWGGFQGEGSKTIIPAHAHAKVSCRLVAAQDPRADLRGVPRPTSRRSRRPA